MTQEELNQMLEEVGVGFSKMPALSIRQPWCYRILHSGKDIENRDWATKFRGPVLLHAGKQMDADEETFLGPALIPRGGIVGVMEIVDCVDHSDSEWFFGKYGFVIHNALPLDLIPCKGALGFFKPKPYEGA